MTSSTLEINRATKRSCSSSDRSKKAITLGSLSSSSRVGVEEDSASSRLMICSILATEGIVKAVGSLLRGLAVGLGVVVSTTAVSSPRVGGISGSVNDGGNHGLGTTGGKNPGPRNVVGLTYGQNRYPLKKPLGSVNGIGSSLTRKGGGSGAVGLVLTDARYDGGRIGALGATGVLRFLCRGGGSGGGSGSS